MAIKYEFNTVADGDSYVGDAWLAQTFTPSVPHTIFSVKLLGYRDGSIGTITIGIRNTAGGAPSGSNLCSGTFNGDTLPDGVFPTEYFEVIITSGSPLVAGTKYAIVISHSGAGNLALKYNSGNDYADGQPYYSEDSGATWDDGTAYANIDVLFEDWGTTGFIPKVFIV